MWGNGAATALMFGRSGAKIFGCDLNIKAAQHTQQRLQKEGITCDVTTCDVTKSSEVERLVKECMDKHGRIDVLVNNVGQSQRGGPADMPEEVWDGQMAVNLKSVYLCCHIVLPIMEKQKSGAIVNIASIAAIRYIGKPQIGYNVSKAGVIQFTKATAVIYAKTGVRLNVVLPGLMHTPLIGMLADKYNNGDKQGLINKRDNAVPMGTMGDGFDTANAVVFLASNQARHITGQKLIVDGGVTSETSGG